ncbi:MAG: exodeoxyribonuclease VII large subunit, partial [Chloroflexota bacterium]
SPRYAGAAAPFRCRRTCSLHRVLDYYSQRVDDLRATALLHLKNSLGVRRERLRGRQQELASLSPLATLARGYALVQHAISSSVISHIEDVRRGDAFYVRVTDGNFAGRVTGPKKGVQGWMNSSPSKRR